MLTIPTSWTSTGIIWDFADPLWPRPKLDLCKIETIKEKDSNTDRAVPVLLAAGYNPIRAIQTMDYVLAIHDEVTALIPLFVNHLLPTATPGNYNGETVIPNWTEATIISAIGDTYRIVPTHLGTLSYWYFQTYKILNMLRWVKKTPIRSEWLSKEVFWEGKTWEQVLSQINSMSWTSISPYSISVVTGDNYVTHFIDCKLTYLSLLANVADVYYYGSRWEDPYATYWNYNDIAEGKYNFAYSKSNTPVNAVCELYNPWEKLMPCTASNPYNRLPYNYRYSLSINPFVVLKFNFKFKNW